MITWHLEKRKIKDLKPHPKNPRELSKDQERHLSVSIKKFGVAEKPVINTNGTIIGGHQRLRILKKDKIKEIECWVPDRELNTTEIDELNIRLNKNTGQWDYDILANQWDLKDLLEWGFTPDELDLGDITDAISEDTEEDELLEPPSDPITKPGDLYELGPHRLLCGDSTLPDDVLKVLNGAKPILMATDPPYGVNYDPAWRVKHKRHKGNKVSTEYIKPENDNEGTWSLSWSNFPGLVCYIWHAHLHAAKIEKSLQDLEFEITHQIIWLKDIGISRGDYHWRHEPCFYATRKGSKHNWQRATDQTTVWEIPVRHSLGAKEDIQTNHACQKPLECMARPIRNNTAKGEGVYDPFLGSGTTLIAAENLSRVCYGLEIDPAYCDIIVDRYKKFMEKNGKPAIIKRNGQETQWKAET